MVTKPVEDGYLLVLERGEKLVKGLTDFCIKQKIKAGFISGLGAVSNATVGYYYLGQKRYKYRKLNRLLEIVSLSGNVASKSGKPWLHLHVVLSDSKLRAYGGHLKEAVVGGTCEVHLQVTQTALRRTPEPETGLDLLS